MITPEECAQLCTEAAGAIYGHTPPSAAYQQRVARQLAGTAEAESLLRYRRQTVFDWTENRGAWGIFQTERRVVQDVARYLDRRRDVLKHVAAFVFQSDDSAIPRWLLEKWTDAPNLLRWLSGFDRLAVAQCRLHYLLRPSPIPYSLSNQAAYWKRHYNTMAGAGTVEGYVAKYHRYFALHLPPLAP